MSATLDIGFIGLGAMGEPMARHLMARGHRLHLWARRAASLAPFAHDPVTVHATPAALAAATDAAFTIVTGSDDVRALALSEDPAHPGFVQGARPGWLHVDMSTIAPDCARELAAAHAARGLQWLDAPVSGGSAGARAGTLAVMVGGEADALERARPLLEAFSSRIVHIGPAGAGQVAKACNQMIMVAAIEACAEAMRLAGAHGLDLAKVREALLGGSAGSRVLEIMGQRMVSRDFAAGVEARLHHKDFGLIEHAAHSLGVPLPVTAVVAQQLNALIGQGGGRLDSAALLRVLEGG